MSFIASIKALYEGIRESFKDAEKAGPGLLSDPQGQILAGQILILGFIIGLLVGRLL